MENIPYNGAQEDDQENNFLESFENDDTKEDDEESEITSKKKKKAQSYFKVLFSKFFLADKKEKPQPEETSLGDKILKPFIEYEEVIDLPNPTIEQPELVYAEAPSYSSGDVDRTENSDADNLEKYEDELTVAHYAQATKETDEQVVKRDTVGARVSLEQKKAHKEDNRFANQRSKHDTEAIGSVMMRRVEKKKIKGLEEEVAKVQKKLKKLEKSSKEGPIDNKTRILKQNVSQGLSGEKLEHVHIKQNIEATKFNKRVEAPADNKKESLPQPIRSAKEELLDIRKNIENQFAKTEGYGLSEKPEIINTHESDHKKELAIAETIPFETSKHKIDSSHQKYARHSSNFSLEDNNNKYATSNSDNPIARNLFQNSLPKNYKQAVVLGASYGATITIIILLLIALRMI